MNIALSTIFLISLILPGYLFRYYYLTSGNWALNGTDSIKNSAFSSISNSLTYELLLIIFISVVIHCIALFIIPGHLHFLTVFNCLANNKTDCLMLSRSNNNNINPYIITAYLVLLPLVSGMIGWLLHILIRKFKLDLKFKPFRFDYYWFYVLSGELLAFSENGNQKIPDGTYIEATIEQNGITYLYCGFLYDYSTDEKCELKTLFLINTTRRALTNDIANNNSNEDRFYPIHGTYVALAYKDIKILSIEYFYLDEPKGS